MDLIETTLNKKERQRYRLSRNKKNGKAFENLFYMVETARGNKVVRSPKGRDFIVTEPGIPILGAA